MFAELDREGRVRFPIAVDAADADDQLVAEMSRPLVRAGEGRVTDGPHVWIAEPDEAETVARLLVGFRDHLGHDWPSDNAFLAGVEKLIEDRNTEFVIGAPDADAPPAGVVVAALPPQPLDGVGRLPAGGRLRRGPGRAEPGLGRALVAFALDRARARGCRRAELDVNEGNEPALRLYESLGFGKKSTPWDGRDLFINIRLD